jgi:hypothetical protein
MDNEIIEVKQADMLTAINRAEVDIQIATAKQYPRDVNAVLNKIATYATMDRETAEDCFYVLRRKDANGQDAVIEGLSVRMAEIIAGAWGNLRVQTRIIGNDGRMITAQAVCHDLETNFAVSKEVKRSIVTKKGYTYSQDMQVVTGNAAASIALRNAVLTVIPKAVTKRIINEVRKVALGQSIDLETSRQNIIAYFGKMGVTQQQILDHLGIKDLKEIDQQAVFELRGTANAIKEGTTTVQETFVRPVAEAKKQAEGEKVAKTAQDKAAAAIAQATGEQAPTVAPAGVDPETGEIKNGEQPKEQKKTTTKK